MNRGGLTVAETVIAVALLGLVTLSSLALFTALMASSVTTSQLTTADVFARKHLQAVIDGGLRVGEPPLSAPILGNYTLAVSDQAAATYVYSVSSELVQATTTPLYYLQVEVRWNGQSQAGGGNSTRSGRLVHVQP